MDVLRSLVLTGLTDGSGDATINADIAIYGSLVKVQWIDGDLTDGVDAVFSIQNAGGQGVAFTFLTLTNANSDAEYYPRVQVCDNAGAAITATYDLYLLDGQPRLVISSGGAAHTGGAVLYYYARS